MQNIKDQLNIVLKLFNSGEKQKAFEKINLLVSGNNKNINCLLLHAKICINLNEISKANYSLEKILSLEEGYGIQLAPNSISILKLMAKPSFSISL